jgi:uncharacterized protein YdcH (DUF465 family)
MERHELLYDFPGYREKIFALQNESSRFRKLANEYHETDRHIYLIEEGMEPTSNEHLNELRMKRVHLKDELYTMLQ